ncbi:MAG TPA: beta-ketoacyl-ACP synthase II [Thermodesulfobacteriota bacterium]|nr:beta-ketoacyl-ACP synthase II [Thermodesulfobacteriota bacterium]
MEKRRVVITGMGVVAPNGIGVDNFWDALVQGRSGIKTISRFDASSYPSKIAGEVQDFDPATYINSKSLRRMDRFSQFGVACSKMALADSNVEWEQIGPDSIGVAVGSAIGGLPHAEEQHSIFLEKGLRRVYPLFCTRLFVGSCMNNICIELGIKGPCFAMSTGCATGPDNIGLAFNMIRDGKIDLMLAGAAEAPITPLTFSSFTLIGILSTRNKVPHQTPKPFDKNRDGIVLSEGGTVLLLEELQHALERSTKIYAEVVGYGTSHDAYHITEPAPDGQQAERAIRSALEDAHISPDQIDCVSAHGSATVLNDRVETAVIRRIFNVKKESILVSAIESMVGHPLGAAGAMKIAASALAIKHGIIPPTINYEHPDPDCDLNYVPNKSIEKNLNVVVSNSFSFGGKNSILILKRFSC